MMRASLVVALALAGCKGKDSEKKADTAPAARPVEPAAPTTAAAAPNPVVAAPTTAAAAPNPAAAPTAPSAPAVPQLALRDGESVVPAADLERVGDNPKAWNGMQLAITFAGEQARVLVSGDNGVVELGSVELNAAYSGQYGIVALPDGKAAVVVTSNGGSGDPGFVAGWRIAWDAKARRAVVDQKGNWTGGDKAPAWAKLP